MRTSRWDEPGEEQSAAPGRAAQILTRAATAVLLVLLAALSAVVFLLALDIISTASVANLLSPVDGVLSKITAADLLDRALVAGASALIGVAALALLVRVPSGGAPRAPGKHVLQADDKGLVVIGSESVETVAVETAIRTPGVLDATVRVRGRPSGPIRLHVRVDVLPGSEVKLLGPRVQESVHRSVEDLVGLPVRDANVEVHVLDADELSRVVR